MNMLLLVLAIVLLTDRVRLIILLGFPLRKALFGPSYNELRTLRNAEIVLQCTQRKHTEYIAWIGEVRRCVARLGYPADSRSETLEGLQHIVRAITVPSPSVLPRGAVPAAVHGPHSAEYIAFVASLRRGGGTDEPTVR